MRESPPMVAAPIISAVHKRSGTRQQPLSPTMSQRARSSQPQASPSHPEQRCAARLIRPCEGQYAMFRAHRNQRSRANRQRSHPPQRSRARQSRSAPFPLLSHYVHRSAEVRRYIRRWPSRQVTLQRRGLSIALSLFPRGPHHRHSPERARPFQCRPRAVRDNLYHRKRRARPVL